MRGRLVCFVLLVFAAMVPKIAAAQVSEVTEARRFGDAGQWFVYASSNLDASNQFVRKTGEVSQNNFHFDFEPAVGLFVARDLYVQLGLGVSRASIIASNTFTLPTRSETRLTAEPGIGYNLRLSDVVALFPHLSVSFSEIWSSSFATTARNSLDNLDIVVHVPFAFHMTKHFSLALGAYFAQTLASHLDGGDALKTTRYGVRGGFIGWF